MTYDLGLRTYFILHFAFCILHSALKGPAMPLPEFTLHDFNKIATGELHVKSADMVRGALPSWLRGNAPDSETLVMNAIVEDAKNMGGDKSYKIDIGI